MAADTADTTLKPLTAFVRRGHVASLARGKTRPKGLRI